VALASRGQRDMDHGPEAIADAAEIARVRAQARTVHLKSLAVAAVLTALGLVIP
jgi:hypothetical protein